jgi:pimeloyl-ACP methyl ester carboxylesterase
MPNPVAPVRPGTLKVPGAQLYYEVQGTGPLLLMIPGGPTDAGTFASLAACLVDRYTVVRYDPRGNSRSVVDGPPQDKDMDQHGDDAAQLLSLFGDGPVFVLGSSGGGQIGLNLAARYPHKVKTLVAHEPPCVRFLADAEEQRAFIDGVYGTYRTAGVGAAMQEFLKRTGMAGQPRVQRPNPPSAEMRESFARIQGNIEYFIAHGFKPLGDYMPDVTALKAGPASVVVGVGATSAGQLAHRTGIALAQRLGVVPVMFPGGHGGYSDEPAEFAEKLHEILSDAS